MQYDSDALERAKYVEMAIFDIDGVFTNGKIFLHDGGNEHASFHIRDGLGLMLLKRGNIQVATISGRASQVVKERLAYLHVKECHLGVANKKRVMEGIMQAHDLKPEQVCYTGDDLVDIEAMRMTGLAIAVADAHPLVKLAAHWTTPSHGGNGAVREVCELLLQAKGYSEEQLITWACADKARA